MENRKVAVQSRIGGKVFYQIPEERLIRVWNDGETKMIDFDELKKVQFVDGGRAVLENCLIIKDEEVLKELNMTVEPEYFYTEEKIREILELGSLDELEDTLNFAPAGVIELIQKISVAIELPDTRKRKMILEKTGFNINGAVAINEILAEDEAPQKEEEKIERKVKVASPSTTERKVKVASTKK